jgi:hypothetical protein
MQEYKLLGRLLAKGPISRPGLEVASGQVVTHRLGA